MPHACRIIQPIDQILTVARMRASEEALIAAGTGIDELMQRAGRGAAEYVWRVAGHRRVTVLIGPGNNGGDGYVIAEALRERGGQVAVIAASEPRTDAARHAASLYRGEVLGRESEVRGELLVDCLFGSGLTRGLGDADFFLLHRLAAVHPLRIAIDLPSGIESDTGAALNEGLPDYRLTIALGAWKYAHFLMPAAARMGELRLVGIGCARDAQAGEVVRHPHFLAPAVDAHKYRRGLLGVVAGAMPGAALLAARAAQGAGAGYVKLLGAPASAPAPADLVVDTRDLREALEDARFSALLVGPGLGRDEAACARLAAGLVEQVPLVADADALVVLGPEMLAGRTAPVVVTPHEGELAALERSFALSGLGSKLARAQALAGASGMLILAKGPDTVIAAPDGRHACVPRASSWLSTAGTGDVLAGAVASRLAAGSEPFEAAMEGVWLHGEAARLVPAPFTAAALAGGIASAYRACL